ncbi:MAG: alpha/beta fold hydrolase [Thermoanaerobaculales bacterium]|nr:alpha/beta fold hydrolase [Thermoanaerobaculales bacterium]
MKSFIQESFRAPAKPRGLRNEPLTIHIKQTTSPGSTIIVFVHGLGGKRYGWRATWGELPGFLFDDFDGLDVGLYEYTSFVKRLFFRRSVPLKTEAQVLADRLKALAETDQKIVLIGHSMGGLLIAQALVLLVREDRIDVLERIPGLIFCSTPWLGSLKARWPFSVLSHDGRALKPHGALVTDVTDAIMHEIQKDRFPPEAFALLASNDPWVDKLSGGIGIPKANRVTVRASHTSIVKPRNKENDSYTTIKRWLSTVAGISERPTSKDVFCKTIERLKSDLVTGSVAGAPTIQRVDVVERSSLYIPATWSDSKSNASGEDAAEYLLELSRNEDRGAPVVILGNPGQGKTTILLRVFTALANAFIDGKSQCVPVFIPLREFHQIKNLPDAELAVVIAEYLRRVSKLSEPPIEEVRQRLADNNLVLLVDGFDEILEQPRQFEINKMILAPIFSGFCFGTCRTDFFNRFLSGSQIAAEAHTIELQPFTKPNIKKYINKYFYDRNRSKLGKEFLGYLRSDLNLWEVVARPLLLNMILDVVENGEMNELVQADWNLSEIYRRCVTRWLKAEASKKSSVLDWEQKEGALIVVSVSLSSRGPLSSSETPYGNSSVLFERSEIFEVLDSSNLRISDCSLDKVVNDLCSHSFLLGDFEGRYYFLHKSFQEYFVARHILLSLRKGPDWLLASFSESIPVEVATYLKAMLDSALWTNSEKNSMTLHLVDLYGKSPQNTVRASATRQNSLYYLAKIGTREARDFVAEAIENESDGWVVRGGIIGLVLFCGESERIPQYLELLENREDFRSINLGYHLCYYGDQEFGDGYNDAGGAVCKGTVAAIIRHLRNPTYKNAWALDLFTLRCLFDRPERIKYAEQEIDGFGEFVQEISSPRENDPELTAAERERLRNLWRSHYEVDRKFPV